MDPSIYLMDDENKLPTDISEKVEEPNSLPSDDKNVIETESNPSTDGGNHSENRDGAPQNAMPVERIHADLLNKVSDHLESIDIAANDSVDKGLLFISILRMHLVLPLGFLPKNFVMTLTRPCRS